MAKIYKSKSSLKIAIKKQGLQLMNVEIVSTNGGYYAHFFCAEHEDVSEITGRGFSASYDPESAA